MPETTDKAVPEKTAFSDPEDCIPDDELGLDMEELELRNELEIKEPLLLVTDAVKIELRDDFDPVVETLPSVSDIDDACDASPELGPLEGFSIMTVPIEPPPRGRSVTVVATEPE